MIRPFSLVLASVLFLAACEDDQTKAEGYYQSALALMEEGDVDRALVELRNVFNYDGFHREARQLYADIVLERGNVQEAYSQYLRLIEQYPDIPEVRLTLAELALETGSWDEVERHTQAAVELTPDAPRVRALAATLDYRDAVLEDDEAAKADAVVRARDVLEEDPDALAARRILIDSIVNSRTPTAALPDIDRALQTDPASLEFNFLKFRVLAIGERDEAAQAQLERLYALFPVNEDIRSALISWYIGKQDLDSAETLLRDLAGPDDGPVDGHLTFVQFLKEARGADVAMAELERLIAATEGGDTNATYRAMAATLDFEAGDTDAAIAELESIIEAGDATDETRRMKIVLARMLVATENQVGARALVEEVLEEDTTNVDALKMRAAWRIDADDPDGAINDLRTALSQSPRDPDILTLMATAHERAGSPELAGERLAAAVDVSGAGTAESLRYARYLVSNDRTQAAESILLDAQRANPASIEVLSAIADLWLEAEDWTRLQSVRNALEMVDTEEAQALYASLGTAIALGQNRLEDAIGMVDQFASADERSRATVAIVVTQVRSGRIDEARTFLASALEETPDDPALRLLDGSLELQNENFDAAEAIFRSVVADFPQSAQPVQLLYGLLQAQGRTDEAAEVLAAGLETDPAPAQLLLIKAAVQELELDMDGAIATYEELYERNSGNVLVANNLASLIADHRTDAESLDRAFAIARRLRGLENPALQDTYGWIEYRRGNFEEAVESLEPAAEGLPGNAMVQFHLGMAYAEVDRTEDAREALSRAIGLAGDSPLPQFQTARETLEILTATDEPAPEP